MKRFFLLLAAALLLCSCGKTETKVLETSEAETEEADVNLLEVTFDGKTYDLGQKAADIARQVSDNGKWLIDPIYLRAIGGDGKYSRSSASDLADTTPDQRIYLRAETPVIWQVTEGDLEIPAEGTQYDLYYIGDGTEAGTPTVYKSAEGYDHAVTPDQLEGYQQIGIYGHLNGQIDDTRLIFCINGQPVDLSPYKDELPDDMEEDLFRKMTMLGNYTTLTTGVMPDNVDELYATDPYFRMTAAVGLAGQDAISRLNAGEIDNFAIIEFGFKEGRFVAASYHIFKKDDLRVNG